MQRLVLALILALGLLLRLKGIEQPLLDHPGWRQGDEAAIARNFAFVDLNPLHPQADYDGPGPNYVELELQIVPWIAALGYKLFGVHEIFGRLISIAASLATVAVVFAFGRYLFTSALAGLCAAFLYAVAPGTIYYGRTFQPDTTMAFFLTCALYAGTSFLLEDDAGRARRRLPAATLLLLAAVLAKSVAIVAVVPLAALSIARFGFGGTLRRPESWIYLIGGIVPFICYDRFETSIAEWRWASGITRLHVLPSLVHAFESPHAFLEKASFFVGTLTMLAHTMLGPFVVTLLVLGCVWLPGNRAPVLLYAWLAADLLYAYVVVTVERVDYYLYPFVPLAALIGGAFLARNMRLERLQGSDTVVHRGSAAGLIIAALCMIADSRQEIAPYYAYNRSTLRQARLLDALLPKDALVVQGHLDPSLLYYLHRRGWEEDPYVWTPFDEQSAIAKGARYFIVAEANRLTRNVELDAWLARFPLLATPPHTWRVYVTDPALELPGAERAWRSFRDREKSGKLRLIPESEDPL